MKYSIADVNNLIFSIHKLGLQYTEEFRTASPASIQRMANGVGPGRWPSWTRDIATDILQIFEEAVLIHDVDYTTIPDRTRAGWHETNARFQCNCHKLVRARISFWRFVSRSLAFEAADLPYKAVESRDGWKAFEAAAL